jgi:malonyl-CoA/methylmalonyl-CoA synthetase
VTALDAATPAAIVYTSGTTGRAKGAVLTHGNLAANARVVVEAWRITDADRYLAVLPLFHVHGLGNGVCSWLASGCRMRLVERFESDKAQALFEELRPTLFFGVPTVYVRLLEWPAEAARRLGGLGSALVAEDGHLQLRLGLAGPLLQVGDPLVGLAILQVQSRRLIGAGLIRHHSENSAQIEHAEGQLV